MIRVQYADGSACNAVEPQREAGPKQMRRAIVMARRQLHFEDQRSFFRLMTRGDRVDIAMIVTPSQVETLQRTRNVVLRRELRHVCRVGQDVARW